MMVLTGVSVVGSSVLQDQCGISGPLRQV
jgi:hypothetical protein